MNNKLLPALGIIIASVILLTISEITTQESVQIFIKKYSFLFIISGMLLGIAVTKYINKSTNQTKTINTCLVLAYIYF